MGRGCSAQPQVEGEDPEVNQLEFLAYSAQHLFSHCSPLGQVLASKVWPIQRPRGGLLIQSGCVGFLRSRVL